MPIPDEVLRDVAGLSRNMTSSYEPFASYGGEWHRDEAGTVIWDVGETNVSCGDVAAEFYELREAVRALLECPPAGRRLGKQESMQARWIRASSRVAALLPHDSDVRDTPVRRPDPMPYNVGVASSPQEDNHGIEEEEGG